MFLEQELMKRQTGKGRLSAHFHHGFRLCMGIQCDKQYLDGQWVSGRHLEDLVAVMPDFACGCIPDG
jgi:hypothetical protein